MSDRSTIEWTDATWNPLLGCTKVSPGCDGCYAISTARIREGNPNAKVAAAYAGIVHRDAVGQLDWTGQVNLLDGRLDQPLRWRKPRRIFVNSQSDLFHDEVPDLFLDRVFDVMEQAQHHTFQILTKRHARMRSFVQGRMDRKREYADKFAGCPTEAMRTSPAAKWARERADRPPANIWLGVSVENQQWANTRIPALLDTPAAVRFLSCEPLLGPISLFDNTKIDTGILVDWVIAGGESGRAARPMHPNWIRGLRYECNAYDIPFLFKQWGEWAPLADEPTDAEAARLKAICVQPDGQITPWDQEPFGTPAASMFRIGKKAAGREIDGRTWDQYPAAVS